MPHFSDCSEVAISFSTSLVLSGCCFWELLVHCIPPLLHGGGLRCREADWFVAHYHHGALMTLWFVHIFSVINTSELIRVWHVTSSLTYACPSPPSSPSFKNTILSFTPVSHIVFWMLFPLGLALTQSPCLVWFIWVSLALALVHSLSLPCDIVQCYYLCIISLLNSPWVISSFVVTDPFMIIHLCGSCWLVIRMVSLDLNWERKCWIRYSGVTLVSDSHFFPPQSCTIYAPTSGESGVSRASSHLVVPVVCMVLLGRQQLVWGSWIGRFGFLATSQLMWRASGEGGRPSLAGQLLESLSVCEKNLSFADGSEGFGHL